MHLQLAVHVVMPQSMLAICRIHIKMQCLSCAHSQLELSSVVAFHVGCRRRQRMAWWRAMMPGREQGLPPCTGSQPMTGLPVPSPSAQRSQDCWQQPLQTSRSACNASFIMTCCDVQIEGWASIRICTLSSKGPCQSCYVVSFIYCCHLCMQLQRM